MVKLQSSKLTLRVRFPLTLFFYKFKFVKINIYFLYKKLILFVNNKFKVKKVNQITKELKVKITLKSIM